MFRNVVDVISIEGITVDAMSLWRFDERLKLLVLEDEDQHVTHTCTNEFKKEKLTE